MPAEYWIDGLPASFPDPAGDKYWIDGLPEGAITEAAGTISNVGGLASGAECGIPILAGPIIVADGPLSEAAIGSISLARDQAIEIADGPVSEGVIGLALLALEQTLKITAYDAPASGALIGSATLLGPVVGNFRFFIDGVERASYVAPGSFRRRLELNSRGTAEFVTRDDANSYRPKIDQEVVIYEGKTRVFAGTIEALEEIVHEGTDLNEILVRCNDYGVLCDRRICARYYPLGGYSTSWAMVKDIVERDLAGTGINYAHDWVAGDVLGEMLFNYITVSEALNRIMEAVGGWWRVDFWGNLRIFPADQGYENAPFGLTETSENWVEMRVERSRAKYRNRQGVRTNRGLAAVWTDTAGIHPMAAPDGNIRFFLTSYIPSAVPLVKVNGVAQIVCDGVTFPPGWQWYYFPNSYGIVQNPAEPVLQPGDTLTVEYPSPLDYVVWAQDDAGIAAHGLYEAVEELQDIPLQDLVNMEAIAAALLARGKVIPVGCTFRTDEPGLEPGQLITVNTERPLLDDALLIEQVESHQVQDAFLWHVVRSSNAPQRTADSSGFFARLIECTKLEANRVVELIRFTVAESYEGGTNPGLTPGLKTAVATAQYAGVLGSVRLSFPMDPPTVSDVTIDVLKNGVSVFGSVKLTFLANGAGTYEQWVFAANPLPVAAGDVFTYEVTAADPTAKDGILELVILR